MKLISIIVAAAIALSIFVALNWTAFVSPTTISLGVTAVQAPLGLIMLAATVALCGLLLAHILLQQAVAVLELRRAAKDLHAQRELADRAEASRFTELRGALDEGLRGLETRDLAALGGLREQLAGIEERLIARADESTLSLTAHLGEIEDKLDRVLDTASADAGSRSSP